MMNLKMPSVMRFNVHYNAIAFATIAILLATCSMPSSSYYARPPPRKIISTPHNGSDSHPQQVHISLAGPDYMRISWITTDKKTETEPSLVEYGTKPGQCEASATGDHTSYHYFSYTSGRIHHVVIGPLQPSTTYYYRCGGAGPEFSLKTPPSHLPLEFVVAGDLGQTEWTASTLRHVNNTDYDVLLLPGDLSYADGQQPLWDTFERFVEPYASHRPWMVTDGNHEVEAYPITHTHAFKAYNARWVMPFAESGSHSNLYYSFDVAGVHVIMLGSYADFDPGSAQYNWLKADLGKVDRGRTTWVVAVLHAPWYNTNIAHQGEGEGMRRALEELLYRSRVDLVFAGHVHAYERFTRVYNNKPDPCGAVHVTIGDGGNREGLALAFKEETYGISLFREASFGHGRLRVVNGTHAHWSWHRNDDSYSTVRDDLWITSLSSSADCWPEQMSKSQLKSVHNEL